MARGVEFTARIEGGSVVWDDPDGKPAKDHSVHVAKGAPPQTIEFKLKDKTGLGLRFNESDPFHVWEKVGCPPPGVDTDQIEVVHSTSSKVRIVNRNTGSERTLQYQLNVIGDDGKEWPCDPIIRNDGGGPGFE
jgi:hypothetical protein